jgi:hypothetical protein
LDYSSWPKHFLQQAKSEIINGSDSEENTEISDSDNFSEHFKFSGSSNSSSSTEEEISSEPEPSRGHKKNTEDNTKITKL